jgi:hypothetical protein
VDPRQVGPRHLQPAWHAPGGDQQALEAELAAAREPHGASRQVDRLDRGLEAQVDAALLVEALVVDQDLVVFLLAGEEASRQRRAVVRGRVVGGQDGEGTRLQSVVGHLLGCEARHHATTEDQISGLLQGSPPSGVLGGVHRSRLRKGGKRKTAAVWNATCSHRQVKRPTSASAGAGGAWQGGRWCGVEVGGLRGPEGGPAGGG